MGYECPVCGDPQADETHLANHLAFTAIARGGDHEAWLDEHVPEWGQLDDEGLADAVVELAEETDFPQVFEDTTADRPQGADMFGDAEVGPAERDILSEAIEMTEQRRKEAESDDESE